MTSPRPIKQEAPECNVPGCQAPASWRETTRSGDVLLWCPACRTRQLSARVAAQRDVAAARLSLELAEYVGKGATNT